MTTLIDCCDVRSHS